MVVIPPITTSNKAHDHPAPDTDLPFGLILLAIVLLALIFHLHGHSNSYAVIGSYGTTSDDDTSDDSDSNLEPGLDCVAPTRTYKQWRVETSELTSIGSCFDICAICLESFLDEDRILRLQCDHIFHSSCFGQWFFSHDTCPICKSWITAENFTVT